MERNNEEMNFQKTILIKESLSFLSRDVIQAYCTNWISSPSSLIFKRMLQVFSDMLKEWDIILTSSNRFYSIESV
jgi:hypothetical protein